MAKTHFSSFFFLVFVVGLSHACTNYLVTPLASETGAAMISYAADSDSLYGTLGHYPAGSHPPGEMIPIYDWDSGKYRGEIKQVNYTYNVIGNINEYQVTIAETTFGGLESLQGQDSVLDYGNLIWITLQRSKTAREAIAVMGHLVEEYGYASEGESFSIGDPNEVWVLEMIGKGPNELGAVWVAVRIPDGCVSGHSNQARIRTFPHYDPVDCIYAPDVVTFAQSKGLYPSDAPASEFSFSDIYDPVDFFGARMCELRSWHFFQAVSQDLNFGNEYLDYVRGQNLTNRMPLYLPVRGKISRSALMEYMRTQYQGTEFDMTVDVGAGGYNAGFRARPLTWSSSVTGEKKDYFNERPVGAQQTGWHFVSEMRHWMPRQIGGILWFGVDDTSHSVHTPIYCSIDRVPERWANGYGDALNFEWSAFWTFNVVANMAYGDWRVQDEVKAAMLQKENAFAEMVKKTDEVALKMYKHNDEREVIAFLTEFSVSNANALVESWVVLWQQLFVKYRDGFTVTPPPSPAPDHGGAMGGVVPSVHEPGYAQDFYDDIVSLTGEHYLVPPSNGATEKGKDIMESRKLKLKSL